MVGDANGKMLAVKAAPALKLLALAVLAAPAVALALPAAGAKPTIVAQPSIVGISSLAVLSGTVPSGAGDQPVRVEAKECGNTYFRLVGGVRSGPGGGWRYEATVFATTSFRVRSKGAVSRPVLVRRRAGVVLTPVPKRIFVARVPWNMREQPMAGRVVRLERLSERGWVTLATGKLKKVDSYSTQAHFKVVRRGLKLRAVIPRESALPCYAPGVSTVVVS
jgi:hypothetical protein